MTEREDYRAAHSAESKWLQRTARSISIFLSKARFENRFDGLIEEAGDTEGEREAGVIFAGFNCVHGLARHVETSSKFRL